MKTVNILGVSWKLFGIADHHKIALKATKVDKNFIDYGDSNYQDARKKMWFYAMNHIEHVITDGTGPVIHMVGPRLRLTDELSALYKRNVCRDTASYRKIVHHIKVALARFREECGYHKKPMKIMLPSMSRAHPETSPDAVENTFLILRSYVINYVLGYYPAWPFVTRAQTASEEWSVSRWHGPTVNGYYRVMDDKPSVFDDNTKAMQDIFVKLKRATSKVTSNNYMMQTFSKNARDVLEKHVPEELVAKGYRLMDSYMAHIMARVMMGCIRESRRKDISDETMVNCELGFSKGEPNFIDRFKAKWTNHYDSQYEYPHTGDYSGGTDLAHRNNEWNRWYHKDRWVIASPISHPQVTRTMSASRTEFNACSGLITLTDAQVNGMSAGYYWFKGIDAGVKYEKLMSQIYHKKEAAFSMEGSGTSAYFNARNSHRWMTSGLDGGLYTNDLQYVDSIRQYMGTPAYEDRSNYSEVKDMFIRTDKISPKFFERVFSRGLSWSGGITTHVYSKPREIGHDMIVYEGVRSDHGGEMKRIGANSFQKYVDEHQCINPRQYQRLFVKHRPTGITTAINCDTLKLVQKYKIKHSDDDWRESFINLPNYDDVCKHEVSDKFIDAFIQYISALESIDSMRIFSDKGRKLHDLIQEDTEIGNCSLMRRRYAELKKEDYDPSIAIAARAAVKKFYVDSDSAIATAHDCRILAGHIIAPTAMNYTINNCNSFMIPCENNMYLSRTGHKVNVTLDSSINCRTDRLIVADNYGSAVTEHPIPHLRSGMPDLDVREDLRLVGIALASDINFPTIIRSKSIFNK